MSDEASPKKKAKPTEQKTEAEKEEEWREVFKVFDQDHNGKVSASEMGSLLRGLGYSPSKGEVEKMVRSIDTNRTGWIEWEEFKEFMRTLDMSSVQEQKEDMLKAFQIFDYNGDGHIDAKELQQVMTTTGEKLSEEEVNQMISVADIDKDGKINYVEFVNFIFSERS